MKQRHRLPLVLIITLILFTYCAGFYRTPPTVKATYVEGTILQNTDWTLTDSPFILSNNIIVAPGVTLTIDPGVQVRFAQNFSITVNGRIIADGTDDRPILFTSNSLNATVGDWGTILINGTQQSSLTHCTIEYGTDAVTLQSGFLNLQDDQITSNGNGTTVYSGTAVIDSNVIANNTINGVSLAQDSQATVHDNAISSNGNGIFLAGNLTANISITHNNITLSSQSGIILGADAYYNTTIQQNIVSNGNYGFLVATNTSTYITHNYIINNTQGIFYQDGTGHEAHFNDISDNALGMDVSSSATVDATYNYWGNETGPFHTSLNPHGKGNPVGGDGVNLDFIFFLSEPFDYNNAAPTATLQTDKTLVAPNQTVTLIGTNSFDDGRVDQYLFNFGDGHTSGWTTLSLFNHTYSTVGNYTAALTVMDDFGITSLSPAATTITVMDLTPLTVSMTLSSQVADYNSNVTVTVQVSNAFQPAESATVTLFSLKGGSFSQTQGETDSNGIFTTTFTAPNATDVTYVRLMATASQAGMADGSSHTYMKVLPLLHVQVTTQPPNVKSEATATLIFHVSDGLGQPVSNASLTATVDAGTLSQNTNVTTADGTATLFYTAPYTLDPLNINVTSTAQKPGYTDGHDQETITVQQNILAVQATPDSSEIISEGTTNVATLVTCDNAPIPNANVTISTENKGTFNPPTALTDSNGIATFLYTAPQTTTTLNASITATATKTHYVDAADQTTINITPKTLTLQVTTQSNSTTSETKLTLTASVAYNYNPVQDANVTVATQNGGNITQPTTTNAQGLTTFTFTAPQVNETTDFIITAQASKTGYATSQYTLTLSATPGNLSVQVTTISYAILSGDSSTLTVTVASNSNPVENAQVTISANAGNLATTTGLTDSNGTCTFWYNAPTTNVTLSVEIAANVTKNGYIQNSTQTRINVFTEQPIQSQGAGYPIIDLLLIVIPIIIAAVIAFLIKSKIIVISTGEEGSDIVS